MNEKGIPKPPEADRWFDGLTLTVEAWRWVSRVYTYFPKVQTMDVVIDPASVSANSTSEQTFTVTGLTVQDRVVVNKPTHTSGLVIGGARVSAADTLAIVFGNLTGSAINPPSESYRIGAIRR